MKQLTARLFCFDFDNTIVDGHFHNYLVKKMHVAAGKATPEQIDQLLNEHAILNQAELLKTFKAILAAGHHLAITTWSLYPEVVVPTLTKLGLTKEEIALIHIESGLPLDPSKGKSIHIAKAKQHFGVKDNDLVCLIDDNRLNVQLAFKEGQRGIYVESPKTDASYLQIIQIAIEAPKPRRNIRIAELNTQEGQRLFEAHNELRAKGKKRQGVRKDGEKPLARFFAKNPEMAPVAPQISATPEIAPSDITQANLTFRKPKQAKKEDNDDYLDKLYKASSNNLKKREYKLLFTAGFFALSLAAFLTYSAVSIAITITLCALLFTSIVTIGKKLTNLTTNAMKAHLSKDKWITDNKVAYDLGCKSAKAWVPYLTSYVQPKAYTSAYQVGFITTSIANNVIKRPKNKPKA